MNKIFLTFLFAVMVMLSSAQNHRIDGTINGLANEDVFLMRILGQNRTIVDTATTDPSGSFTFQLEEGFPVGMYSLIYGPGQPLDLIYNNENIRFVAGDVSGEAPVQIVESVENLIYYDYLFLKGYNLYKMDLLEPLLQTYPKDDDFYQQLLQEYKQLGLEIQERVETLTSENPNTIASHFILADAPLYVDPTLSPEMKKQYQKVHYFDQTDFTDTLLMRSNILTAKVIGYLSVFQEKDMTKEEMENGLLIGVDTILYKAMVDQQVYEFVIDFLIDGFQAVGFERGLEYVAEQNQLDQFC